MFVKARLNTELRGEGCRTNSRRAWAREAVPGNGEGVNVGRCVPLTALMILIVAVTTIGLCGCDRKQQNVRKQQNILSGMTLRKILDLSDPARPAIVTHGLKFDAKAFDAGLVREYGERTIGNRKYFGEVFYKPPASSSGTVLASNEIFALWIALDSDSSIPGQSEILMGSRIDVELSVKPEGIALSIVDATTGKRLSERNVFPPGTYAFHVVRPVAPDGATTRGAAAERSE